jgi:hypothetical protein
MKPYRVTFIISEYVSISCLVDAAYAGSAQMKALLLLVDSYPRFTYEVDKASSSGAVKVELL